MFFFVLIIALVALVARIAMARHDVAVAIVDTCEAGEPEYVRTPRGGYVMNDCQVDVFEPFKNEDHRACSAAAFGTTYDNSYPGCYHGYLFDMCATNAREATQQNTLF